MKQMTKKVIGILLTSLLILSGCSEKNSFESKQPENSAPPSISTEENTNKSNPALSTETKNTTGKKIVIDAANNEVELPEKIEKIAITPIPWASIIWAIDGTSDRIVSINPSSMAQYNKSFMTTLSPEFGKISTGEITKDFAINIESLSVISPDIVFLWNDQQTELEQLQAVGITPVMLNYAEDLQDLRKNINIVGQVLDKEEKANAVIAYHEKAENYFIEKQTEIEKATKPKVMYLQNKELKVAGSKNINQYLLNLTGGQNVGEELNGKWGEVDMEQVLAWNPDIIYLSNFDDTLPEDLYENKIEGQDWSNIDAVKNKRVYKTPVGILRYDAPCMETPLMLYWMAEIQQPELFQDISFKNELTSFYKEFLNHELTDAEYDQIANTALNGVQ